MAGSVSVVLVRPLVAALGTPRLESLCEATDLTPALIADDDARITPAQFSAAWAHVIRTTAIPHVALDIAAAIPSGSFGIVEYVCRSAPNVRAAIERWVRYLNLLDDAVRVGFAVEDDRAALRVEVESDPPAPAAHELCFALVARYARELSTAPFRLLGVDFAHRTNADPARYRAFFDAPIQFGAPVSQLVFPRSVLDCALVSSDPHLLAILTRAADDLQAKAPPEPALAAQVARVLRQTLRDDEGHIELVAKRLGLTPRSLQRRLKDEGASFNDVREQVRRELAHRYLEHDMSIAEISFLLGFSEPSAFFRAFKRWTGQTPIEAKRAAVVAH